MSPTSQGSVYIAPNMTFDFTEIQYQGKTVAQAEADWAAQFNALAANAAGTPIVVWPIHDYGAAAWITPPVRQRSRPTPRRCTPTSSRSPTNAGYEFVTLEDLASRIAELRAVRRHLDGQRQHHHRDGRLGPRRRLRPRCRRPGQPGHPERHQLVRL